MVVRQELEGPLVAAGRAARQGLLAAAAPVVRAVPAVPGIWSPLWEMTDMPAGLVGGVATEVTAWAALTVTAVLVV